MKVKKKKPVYLNGDVIWDVQNRKLTVIDKMGHYYKVVNEHGRLEVLFEEHIRVQRPTD